MVARLRPAVAIAHGLRGVAILQQLDHDVVELHEADIQTLIAAPEVGDAEVARIDLPLMGQDLLVQQDGVVDLFAVKVAITHHLVAAEHFGVKLEGAIHVLDGDAEVLHALQTSTERPVVPLRRGHALTRLSGRGRRRANAGSRQAGDDRAADGSKDVAATIIGQLRFPIVRHLASPSSMRDDIGNGHGRPIVM